MPQHNEKDPLHSSNHFGFKKVSSEQKNHMVREVFDSVAPRYDVMNDVMSLGLHRLWKRAAVLKSHIQPGQRVLDLAAGTGDMTRLYLQAVGKEGEVTASDINESMLKRAKQRLTNEGHVGNVQYVLANAESLPFADDAFDCVSIAFGLRNVADQDSALKEMYRVLKPGGCAIILEFSKPRQAWLNTCYDWYSFNVIPRLGQWITGDRDSYQYLVESIRMHPDQETLKSKMLDAGFDEAEYENFNQGMVALHRGFKY